MFYSIDGKIVKLEGGFPQRKVNTLTFEVQGTHFPEKYGALDPLFLLSLYGNQNINVNFGDGNNINYLTSDEELMFRGDLSNGEAPYEYQDENTGPRLVTFTFDDLTKLKGIAIQFCDFIGSFPIETGSAINLDVLSLRSCRFDFFPQSLTYLNNVVKWITRDAINGLLPQISDGLFNSPIEELTITATYDLSDTIASNFFKINQLKDTLQKIQFDRSLVSRLPDSILECKLIKDVRADFNNWYELPKQLEQMPKLEWLALGNIGYELINPETLDFSNLNKLEVLILRFLNLEFHEIPIKWKGLVSLKIINGSTFNTFINEDVRFDEFIGYFYTLCTNEAYLDTSTPAAQADEYTHKFRDISWGDSPLTPTGTYQTPTGFVQGVSNGNPGNEAEKIYVLVNNYGHTVTFNQP